MAAAVAPHFLTPDAVTMPTASPCGQVRVVAAGYPFPTVTETGAAPPGLFVLGSTGDQFDPGAGSIGPLNGVCPSTSGTYQFTFDATNVAGSASQNMTLTLSATQGKDPVFTSPKSAVFTAGVYNAFVAQIADTSVYCGIGLPYYQSLPPGLTLDDEGELSGVPDPGTTGTYDLTLECVSYIGVPVVKYKATQDFTLQIVAPDSPPAITSPPTATLSLGLPDSAAVAATGSPTPSLTEEGPLPPGTSFVDRGNGTATISGVATALGSFPITIEASNSQGTAQASLTVSVVEPQAPQFTSPSTVTLNPSSSTSFQLAATGVPPPVFSLVSGTLPDWLTLSANGQFSGPVVQAGLYPVIVEASNGVSPAAVQDLDITVPEQPGVAVYPSSVRYVGGPPISVAAIATAYPLATIGVSGLPPGFSMAFDGDGPGPNDQTSATITGTPTEVGTFPVVVTATNTLGTATATLTLDIVALPLKITTPSLPAATVKVPYSEPLQVAGGVAPYRWRALGKLPRGLKLLKSTGVITGTPKTGDSGTDTFTVEVESRSRHRRPNRCCSPPP